MGGIADDAIEGFACKWCGVYFLESHGYPVICVGCFREWKANRRKEGKSCAVASLLQQCGLQVASIKEL